MIENLDRKSALGSPDNADLDGGVANLGARREAPKLLRVDDGINCPRGEFEGAAQTFDIRIQRIENYLGVGLNGDRFLQGTQGRRRHNPFAESSIRSRWL